MKKFNKIAFLTLLATGLVSCNPSQPTSSSSSSLSSVSSSNSTNLSNSSSVSTKTWNQIDLYGHDLPNYEFNQTKAWSIITNQSESEDMTPNTTRSLTLEGEFYLEDLLKYEQVLFQEGYVDITEYYTSDPDYGGHKVYNCFFEDGITYMLDIYLGDELGSPILESNVKGERIYMEIYAEQGSLLYPSAKIDKILEKLDLADIEFVLPDNVKYYMYVLLSEVVDGKIVPSKLLLSIYCDDAINNMADYIIKLTNANYDMENNMTFVSPDNSYKIQISLSEIKSNNIELYNLELYK